MTEPSEDDDERLLLNANALMLGLWNACDAGGGTPEDLWIVLAVSARLAERGIMHTDRTFGTDKFHQQASARLQRVLAACEKFSDAVDAERCKSRLND